MLHRAPVLAVGAFPAPDPGCIRSQRFRVWFPGLPGPGPRVLAHGGYAPPNPAVHFCTHKSEPKKRQPPSGWTPAFCPIGHYEIDTGQPLKYCGASGSLVTGAVGYELRLTALGMKGISWYATVDPSFPLTGRQPKPDQIPAADQMLKKGISVARQQQI